jgi:hypothetical protein
MKILKSEISRKGRVQTSINLIPLVKSILASTLESMRVMVPELKINNSELVEDIIIEMAESDKALYATGDKRWTLKWLIKEDIDRTAPEIENRLEKKKEEIQKNMEGLKLEAREEIVEEEVDSIISDIESEAEDEFEELEPGLREEQETILRSELESEYEEDDLEEELENRLDEALEKRREEYISQYIEDRKAEEIERDGAEKTRVLEKIENQLDDAVKEFHEGGWDYLSRFGEELYERLLEKYQRIFEELEWFYDKTYLTLGHEELEILGILKEGRPFKFMDMDYVNGEYGQYLEENYVKLKRLIYEIKQKYRLKRLGDLPVEDIKAAVRDIKAENAAKRMEYKVLKKEEELKRLEDEISFKKLELKQIEAKVNAKGERRESSAIEDIDDLDEFDY